MKAFRQESAPGLSVVFVAQSGELGLKAAFLAWSLRHTHGRFLDLFAAVPEYGAWGRLEPDVIRIFERLSVKIIRFTPPFAPEYPIGNKTRVLSLLPVGRSAVFMDSDMVSMAPWSPLDLLSGAEVAVKPADVQTWGGESQWGQVFELLGKVRPTRYCEATVTKSLMPAYYNAGLLACVDPRGVAEEWERLSGTLHQEGSAISNRYPWLDQIALAVLLNGGERRIHSLGEYWNFPAHLKALPVSRQDVGLCHYHRPGVILREPRLLRRFRKACLELPELARLARKYEEWRLLFRPKVPWLKKDLRGCDFIVTGIPRSGTSLVCRLLDEQKNCLVVNEPAEVFSMLESRADASGISYLHREIRERVITGRPIENKVDAGEVIADTAHNDERQLYHPSVSGRFFRLGSKNTLAYMAGLDSICKLGWPVVAMIRHPMDTLSSWRSTFEHLRRADVNNLPIANPDFHSWAGWQRQAMLNIASQEDEALRRVLLWRLLARTLLAHRGKILLWRYEDLVENPVKHIQQLRKEIYGKGWPSRVSTEVSPKSNGEHHSEEERWLLRELCSSELKEFGYEL